MYRHPPDAATTDRARGILGWWRGKRWDVVPDLGARKEPFNPCQQPKPLELRSSFGVEMEALMLNSCD
jgi:hypothetical protein